MKEVKLTRSLLQDLENLNEVELLLNGGIDRCYMKRVKEDADFKMLPMRMGMRRLMRYHQKLKDLALLPSDFVIDASDYKA